MVQAKVNRDVAIAEFERWAEVFEISLDEDDLSEEEVEEVKTFRTKFVTRVMNGSLTVDDDGVISFTPRGDKGEPLRFEEPTGALLSSRAKNDNDAQAIRRTLSAWASVPASRFADTKLRDFNFLSNLLGFFGNS